VSQPCLNEVDFERQIELSGRGKKKRNRTKLSGKGGCRIEESHKGRETGVVLPRENRSRRGKTKGTTVQRMLGKKSGRGGKS